jgi:hypothetical protein
MSGVCAYYFLFYAAGRHIRRDDARRTGMKEETAVMQTVCVIKAFSFHL